MSEQQGQCQWPYEEARCAVELTALRAALSTIAWQATSYLARCRAELPQGDALWLCETALGHIHAAATAPLMAPARAEATTK